MRLFTISHEVVDRLGAVRGMSLSGLRHAVGLPTGYRREAIGGDDNIVFCVYFKKAEMIRNLWDEYN